MSSTTTRHRRPFAARVRVATLLLAIGFSAFCVLGMQAQARAHELIASAGEQMLTYARAQHSDGARTLQINGVPLHLVSGSTPDSVAGLLDFMHARCRDAGGRFEEQLQQASRGRIPRIAGGTRVPLDGVLRLDDEHGGYLACLDLGATRIAPEELLRRVQAFLATGNLAEVGDLRFIWATRSGQTTNYVAVFTQGPVPLLSMFPTNADAPGVDLPEVPRPARSQRLLSTWQQDQAPMLVSYRVAAPLGAAEADFRALLVRHGYAIREPDARAQGSHAWLAERGASSALAIFAADGPRRTVISLTPLH